MKNDVLSTSAQPRSLDAFFYSTEPVNISGDYDSPKHHLTVKGGDDNILFNRFVLDDIGFIGNSSNKSTRMKAFTDVIEKQPSSIYLLYKLIDNRNEYTKEDLKKILSLFTKNIQNSELAKKLKQYIANRPDANTTITNFTLRNSEGSKGTILDHKSKLTMIVFWAGWCKPCIDEIPNIRKLDSLYRNKGLSIVSIFIDQSETNWKRLIKEKRMTWTQLIVEKSKIEEIQNKFFFNAIPTTIFVDQTGKEIERFTGFDVEENKSYESLISSLLK
nr:TlpA disulfide reductase family protein [Mucilaginibacter flavidus]